MTDEETTIESIGAEARHIITQLQAVSAAGLGVTMLTMALDAEDNHTTCAAAAEYLSTLAQVIQTGESRLEQLRALYLERAGEATDLEAAFRVDSFQPEGQPPAPEVKGHGEDLPGLYL